ncbi:N-acetyltransferase [Acidithiobacillus sp. IBUN Pt1247-S3]|uniref:N-acetyltransferase n=1 Tax=Acidithiobacillus sp. IBUN Pt1247-S3 TaxID=3166642 RepID=UPI0034E4EDB6
MIPATGWRVEALQDHHHRQDFRCGEAALDDWLQRYGGQSQKSGLARSFVAVEDAAPTQIVGYYALSAGAIDKTCFPAAFARRFPRFPLPVVRLARLAVALGRQGEGWGEALLMDALYRSLQVAGALGFVALLVDAKHETARRFYGRYEFDTLPDHPLTLWIPLRAIRQLFADRQ